MNPVSLRITGNLYQHIRNRFLIRIFDAVPVPIIKPDKNKIEHESSLEYLWEYNLKKHRIFSNLGGENPSLGKLQNTERLTLENIYTFTDREISESFSNIPVRLTVEHLSSYRLTQLIEFGLNLKTVFGIEEKIIPPSTSGNTLTSMGFEVGVHTKIIF